MVLRFCGILVLWAFSVRQGEFFDWLHAILVFHPDGLHGKACRNTETPQNRNTLTVTSHRASSGIVNNQ